MSIPAGFLVERFSEESVVLACFAAATAGAFSFAVHPTYPVAMVSLFVMGGSMATLQVAVNPLLRVSGGEEHFAFTVSWFWGRLTAGCFVGMFLFKIFDSRRVLIGFSLGSLVALTVALFGSGRLALFAFPALGFFASIMWPTISSLALNSVAENQGAFSGILCTGIAGGAVIPLVVGHLGDYFGLRLGMSFLYLTFGCVLSVGFWATPLITTAHREPRACCAHVFLVEWLTFAAILGYRSSQFGADQPWCKRNMISGYYID